MGVSITCKKPKYTFDMGEGGFFNLRKNVALSMDREFGELYATLSKCYSSDDYSAFDQKVEKMIAEKRLDEKYTDVLDFLFASDCEGKINYKTCGKIAFMLEADYSGLYDKVFRYAIEAHDDYREFIIFLKDCYSHRKTMRWS